MLELVARVAEQFEVDRLTAQAGMLHGFAKGATSEAYLGSLVASSAAVIDDALAADRFDLAESLADAVHRACLGSAGRPFRVDALQRRREVQSLREQWTAAEAARRVLQTDPDDEAAHNTLARWYALVRQQWDRAVEHLAKGADGELKTLAQRELERPPAEPAAQVELADAWWDLAAASGREWQPVLRARAAYWYKAARPRVEGPIVAAKVTRRLDELAGSNAGVSEPVGDAPKATPDRRPVPGLRPPDIGIENPEQIPVGKVREHKVGDNVRQVNASADGRVYAVAAWGDGLTCWNTGTGEVVAKMRPGHTLYGVALSADGRFAVYGGRSTMLHVVDLESKEELQTIPITGWQFNLRLSRDGKHVLAGSAHGARLLDMTKGVGLLRFERGGGWVEDVCFSGDERFVGTVGANDKSARVHLEVVGPGMAWEQGKCLTRHDFPDGTAETILVAEMADSEANWAAPVDLERATMSLTFNDESRPSIGSLHPGVANVLFVDGSVRSLSAEPEDPSVEALLTRGGGEPIDWDAFWDSSVMVRAARVNHPTDGRP